MGNKSSKKPSQQFPEQVQQRISSEKEIERQDHWVVLLPQTYFENILDDFCKILSIFQNESKSKIKPHPRVEQLIDSQNKCLNAIKKSFLGSKLAEGIAEIIHTYLFETQGVYYTFSLNELLNNELNLKMTFIQSTQGVEKFPFADIALLTKMMSIFG